MTNLRIVLVEDHDLTRIGLRTALQRVPGIEVVGESPNGAQGLKLIHQVQPDVAVVDIGLPDIDGIELTRQLKHSNTRVDSNRPRVLILTMQDDEEAVLAAFAAGADSYCTKDISIERLTEALQTTFEGNAWIDPVIANIVLRKIRQPAKGAIAAPPKIEITAVAPAVGQYLEDVELTDRELEILQLIVDGYSNSAISDHLFISLGTVKTHVRNILNKLCADDRTQAAVMALRSGLIN
jgi:DNA-binding NarL/FixJ family response regulator